MSPLAFEHNEDPDSGCVLEFPSEVPSEVDGGFRKRRTGRTENWEDTDLTLDSEAMEVYWRTRGKRHIVDGGSTGIDNLDGRYKYRRGQ